MLTTVILSLPLLFFFFFLSFSFLSPLGSSEILSRCARYLAFSELWPSPVSWCRLGCIRVKMPYYCINILYHRRRIGINNCETERVIPVWIPSERCEDARSHFLLLNLRLGLVGAFGRDRRSIRDRNEKCCDKQQTTNNTHTSQQTNTINNSKQQQTIS